MRAILDFVEGRLEAADFEAQIYENPDFEAVFDDENLHLQVIAASYRSPSGVLDVHAALTQFLERQGVACRPTSRYGDFYRSLLRAQPRWLDVPMEYLTREILPLADATQRASDGPELENWLRDELLRRFRFAKKPPVWVQNPAWPIGENGPLVFVGQLPMDDFFHDKGAVFVFYDPQTGEWENIVQVQ